MARTGPKKTDYRSHADLRREKARAFRKTARDLFDRLDEGALCDPAVSNAILAAIAYADALTARHGAAVNQKNHVAIPRLLRSALGKQLPDDQAARLTRLIARKDGVQSGAVAIRRSDAKKLLDDLDKFANRAETLLGP